MTAPKIKLNKAVIVEGRYDKIKLDSMVEALIIPTNGFQIFSDTEMRELIKTLAQTKGIIILTDSDAAGFQIRNYLRGMIPKEQITNVYIPDIFGREKRKNKNSKEGKLGVEGMNVDILHEAFEKAGALADITTENCADNITKTDLYECGFSGKLNSTEKRHRLCGHLGLPQRLSANALIPILNSMISRRDLFDLAKQLEE